MPDSPHIAIIGGGPAGLRAAEICALGGSRVSVFDAKRSVGRKLLVAGYGGLNLTHGEELESFLSRYSGPDLPPWFPDLIRRFPPADLRSWAADLGIETFQQRTGRVYPQEMKAAPLLRRWVSRLRAQGVTFHPNHPLTSLGPPAPVAGHRPGPSGQEAQPPIRISLGAQPPQTFSAAILALGGASWPHTGSNAAWVPLLEAHGVHVTPFEAANCGWNHPWPANLIPRIEGQPLKNLTATAGDTTISGELMLTRDGIEGGAIYQLGPALRGMASPAITIDLKPEVSTATLLKKLESVPKTDLPAALKRLRITAAAQALVHHFHPHLSTTAELPPILKNLTIPLTDPRPIAEAISSAGGIAWSEIDEHLMLKKLPGIYVAGEMIDWEAPTGGYLIQACFATATHAARSALERSR